MRGAAQHPPRLRATLSERLRGKRAEVEEAILARVFAIADPAASTDPSYVYGLRRTAASALDYAISAIEAVDPQPIPTELFFQARHAARNGVSLETVLRRYFAGYTLLSDFLISEVEGGDLLEKKEFQRLTRVQAELFDRIIDSVASEYQSEAEAKSRTRHQRRAECVRRLLDGQLTDTVELDYDLHAWHIGVVAKGPAAEEAIRGLKESLDRRLLAIPQGGEMLWAWFGGRRKAEVGEVEHIAAPNWPAQATLAIGEPGKGIAGWRLTHRQAAAALPIALRSSESLIRHVDVSLLASMLQDDLLVTSLHERYLAPLVDERDGGAVMRKTLRAYFAAGRNVSSAAAALEVSRKTVTNRLHAIDERIGRPLSACATEIEAALRLEGLDNAAPVTTPRNAGNSAAQNSSH